MTSQSTGGNLDRVNLDVAIHGQCHAIHLPEGILTAHGRRAMGDTEITVNCAATGERLRVSVRDVMDASSDF